MNEAGRPEKNCELKFVKEVSWFGGISVRQWTSVHITNNSYVCGPSGFQCEQGIDTFLKPKFLKSIVFWTATLVEEVKLEGR